MSDIGFDSPESAAMQGFPPEHCRVLESRASGDDAYVLLNTGSSAQPSLYGVNCICENGRWFDRASGNGPGWAAGNDPDVGTLSLWGNAPPGADMVRVEFEGTLFEEPVKDGAYLFVWWRVPPPRAWPLVTACRIADQWVGVEHEMPEELEDMFDAEQLHFAVQDGDVAQVRLLLAEGRSPNAFDDLSRTPLHYAAQDGHLDIMQVLLDAGADVNAIDEPRIGDTPLRSIADECSLAVATFLVDAGADPRIPGWMQLTALGKAERRQDDEGRRVYTLLKSVADRLNAG